MPRPTSTMSWGGSKIQLPRVRPKAYCGASRISKVSIRDRLSWAFCSLVKIMCQCRQDTFACLIVMCAQNSSVLAGNECRGKADMSWQHLRQLMVSVEALPVYLVQDAELPQGVQADDPWNTDCTLLCACPPAHLNMPWLQPIGNGDGILSAMQANWQGPSEAGALAQPLRRKWDREAKTHTRGPAL